MIQQPTLPGESSAIANEAAVFAHYPVAGNQNGQVVGCDKPSDLARMKPSRSSHIIVGTGLPDRDLAKGLEDRNLGWRKVEPAFEMIRVGKPARGARKVLVQPISSSAA